MRYLAGVVIAGALLVAGCGEADSAGPCVGVIHKLYTEPIPPTIINVGGNNNGSGGVGIPVGGGTKYMLYITRDSGETCSRRVSKRTWLNKKEGERYMYGALPS